MLFFAEPLFTVAPFVCRVDVYLCLFGKINTYIHIQQ